MIQIIQVKQIPQADLKFFYSEALTQEVSQLITFQTDWETGFRRFLHPGEGLFLVKKEGQTIGFGSVVVAPDAPLTAGIGLINHCFILPLERKKGYGNQLFKHLRQFAQINFGILYLNEACPLYERMNGSIDLVSN